VAPYKFKPENLFDCGKGDVTISFIEPFGHFACKLFIKPSAMDNRKVYGIMQTKCNAEVSNHSREAEAEEITGKDLAR
jgi:hypothetical protein